VNYRLLIIDDDPRSVKQLRREVKPLRHEVASVNDQESAYRLLEQQSFDYALVDIRLKADPNDLDPDIEVGYATIRYLKKRYPDMQVVAVTAYDAKSEVNTNAVRAGADDFWSKNPGGSGERLLEKIRRLLENRVPLSQADNLSGKSVELQAESPRCKSSPSESISNVDARIRKLSKTDATILLLGEPGTGKGYYAERIHDLSQRKNKPFHVLNCPQLTKQMLTSELFGHGKGAFTGADSKRKGFAVATVGGTLFLDEIGDLDSDCQAVILRFIEDKEIKPLGSDEVRRIDVRIITATNQDIDRMVADGAFRADLRDRLSGYVIHIPPLRDRGVDEIERLAKSLYRAFRKQHEREKSYKNISVRHGVWQELSRYPYDWPGNVRELRQVIESTLMEVGGRGIRLDDFIQRIEAKKELPKKPVQGVPTSQQSLDELSDREIAVLDFIKENGSIQRKQVEELLGLKNTASWALLRAMNDKELIKKIGIGRNAKYVLS